MHFTKMQGLGNDYIYINCLQGRPANLPTLAQEMSRRRISVGADGIICICPSEVGDFRMEMYNSDGSRGEMCGNGIRCVGKYLYDKGFAGQRELHIETEAGIRMLWLHLGEDSLVAEVTVDMGEAQIEAPCTLEVEGQQIEGTVVSMGNPHFVILGRAVDSGAVEQLGRNIECHPYFPNRTNVEFVEVLSDNCLNMRVWERGSGETLACGTGACAAFAVAHRLGLCRNQVEMGLLGGRLRLAMEGGSILMRGPATTVYEGIW